MVTSPKKHRAVRDEDGDYRYRGFLIRKNEGVPSGYWGRWVVTAGSRVQFPTLDSARAYIDAKLDKETEHGQ